MTHVILQLYQLYFSGDQISSTWWPLGMASEARTSKVLFELSMVALGSQEWLKRAPCGKRASNEGSSINQSNGRVRRR